MKKSLIFVVILALLPAAASAGAEFSLGGFIKLQSFWDSTQNTKNINSPVRRNNDGAFHHGNFRATAQGSRFNFTIKGPKVFGAQATGFIEMDFNSTLDVNLSPSQSYVPALRHAMFRLNWPETELLFGQYWSLFCAWFAEVTEDGPFMITGTPTARIPQIRLTQKFLGDWLVAALVGNPNLGVDTNNNPYSASTINGGDAETPQVQAMVKYAHDWWGKAAYFGRPAPFTAQITGGWQRNVAHNGVVAGNSIMTPGVTVLGTLGTQYTASWLAMGSLFIPVIPTHSANLAGTAALLTQWWIGQAVENFGFKGSSAAVLTFNGANAFNISPLKRFGGFVEGQYYFNNQWYVNAAYGISKTYGLSQNSDFLTGATGAAAANDQFATHQHLDATLWYRPIQALKFGLQYSFAQTNWLTSTTVGTNNSRIGNEHRVDFAGYFYF